jgi:hypothetical protein
MSDNPERYQRTVDEARVIESGEKLLKDAGNVAEYAVPTLGGELGGGLLLAFVAIIILRNRRGYLPEWARVLLGVKRTLHSRSELRPKPSPLQPPAWR